jgi:nitroimidazol reductase NimA-like FMN-containing flavoprotein (pyridoxamine 5'-phosphate oxidase superfamily)
MVCMTPTTQESRELSRGECLSLLPTVPFGRLVFTEGALPAVLPVNFVLDSAGVVIRTAPTGSAARVADRSIVALQADDVDAVRRTGWSVTVVGQARTVHDPVELARLEALPLTPWVAGDRSAFVVVEVGIVTGRRIGGPALLPT